MKSLEKRREKVARQTGALTANLSGDCNSNGVKILTRLINLMNWFNETYELHML